MSEEKNERAEKDEKTESNEPGEQQPEQGDSIIEYGDTDLDDPVRKHRIHLMTIIGEIEGHDVLPSTSKPTT